MGLGGRAGCGYCTPGAFDPFSIRCTRNTLVHSLTRPLTRSPVLAVCLYRLQDAERIARLGVKAGINSGEVLLGQRAVDLEALAVETGQPKYRAKQLTDAIYRKGVRTVDEIHNIPKAWKEALAARGVTVGRSELHHKVVSSCGTIKYLLKLVDGYVVETVGIPERDGNRLTVCVSSEVGCPMRCTFCATGKGGFARNLMPHEIVDQVLLVQEEFGKRVRCPPRDSLPNMHKPLPAHSHLSPCHAGDKYRLHGDGRASAECPIGHAGA